MRERRRVTYANVMSTVAVFVALGGTSYAIARNSVGTRELKDSAVTSAKIRNGTIALADLGASARSAPRGPRGTAGPAGPQGPQGPTGARGPSDARFVSPPSASLSRTANGQTAVGSIKDVAAGAYLIVFTGEATWRESGGLYVRCETQVNGTKISLVKGIVGDAYGGDNVLADISTVDRTTPFDLKVVCYPNTSTSEQATGPGITEPKLAAIRLDSVRTG